MANQQITQVYQIGKDDMDDLFSKGTFADRIIELHLGQFVSVKVSSSTVCDIWDITPTTLSSYVKADVIKPLNPGSSKYVFSLADVLRINPKNKKIATLLMLRNK